MDLKTKFYTIFKSLNPYNYQELSEYKFSSVLKYFLFLILFSVLVMSLLFIPRLYSVGSFVTDSVSHFENFTVNSDFKLKESFNILSDPVVRFESEKKNMTDELFLITPDAITYKRFLIFGASRDIPIGQGVDVTSSARARTLIILGVFFILPALFFWSVIFSIIYFGVMILITLIFASVIRAMLREEIGLLRLLKLCIYSSTIFILLQLLLLPFFRIFWIPLIAYWLLIIIVLFLWRDDVKKGHSESRDNSDSDYSDRSSHYGNKTKEIFGSKSESGFKSGSGHKNEVKDSYDVDEHGNLKGSKKHKKFDEENDGYVEL